MMGEQDGQAEREDWDNFLRQILLSLSSGSWEAILEPLRGARHV